METQNSINDQTNSNATDNKGMHFADKEFCSALLIGLSSLQSSSLYTDVTLETGGISIPAHKNVLAAASSYFRAMFSHEFQESLTGVVKLPDIPPTILRIVLTYIYTGNVDISGESVQDLLKAAHLMELSFLVENCQLFLMCKLNLENAVNTMQISKLYELNDTAASSFKYIVDNFYEIPESEILKLTSSELIEIVNDDNLQVRQEDDVLNVIISWLEYKGEENYDVAFQLMRAVKFSKLSQNYVNELMLKGKFQNRLCSSFIENILSPMAVSHRERSCKSLNLYIYGRAFGGKNRFLKYDIISGKSVAIPQPPGMHDHVECVFIENKMYVIGRNKNIDCYDTVKHLWISCNALPFTGCIDVIVELNGMIYACGGFEGNREICKVERYDPKKDKWTGVASMNGPRFCACGAVLNGRIYVLGGCYGNNVISTCEYYDPLMNSWQFFTPLPVQLRSATAVAYQNALYVIGGKDIHHNITNSFYKCDINTREWSSCPQVPFETAYHISYAIDGKIYVITNIRPFMLGIFDIGSSQWRVKEIKDLGGVYSFTGCFNISGFPG